MIRRNRDSLIEIAFQRESTQQICVEYISLRMTRVLVTFSMLAKIGWAKPTRKINPGAASNDMAVIYALEIFNLALVDLKRYF